MRKSSAPVDASGDQRANEGSNPIDPAGSEPSVGILETSEASIPVMTAELGDLCEVGLRTQARAEEERTTAGPKARAEFMAAPVTERTTSQRQSVIEAKVRRTGNSPKMASESAETDGDRSERRDSTSSSRQTSSRASETTAVAAVDIAVATRLVGGEHEDGEAEGGSDERLDERALSLAGVLDEGRSD